MALSGLHIPAAENSSIYVFDNIFVDIGDDQSISESLSTFSSHILNIIEILKNVSNNSLVLLDELGSGTDPKEGSNLAISILDKLYTIGALTIFSTHYTDIKNFVQITSGFENASFEFDTEHLKPTYKLVMGIPGKSNAFEISKKLGLDEAIIKKAYSLMNNNDIHIEDLLKSIYYTKQKTEHEENEINKNLNQIENLRRKLEKDYSEHENKSEKLIDSAKKEARLILQDAKDEASLVIKEINSIQKNLNNQSIKDLNNIRNSLNNKIKKLYTIDSLNNNTPKLEKSNIKLGMDVHVIPLNQNGIIVSIPNSGNDVQIQIGNIKTMVNINELSYVFERADMEIRPYNKIILKIIPTQTSLNL